MVNHGFFPDSVADCSDSAHDIKKLRNCLSKRPLRTAQGQMIGWTHVVKGFELAQQLEVHVCHIRANGGH